MNYERLKAWREQLKGGDRAWIGVCELDAPVEIVLTTKEDTCAHCGCGKITVWSNGTANFKVVRKRDAKRVDGRGGVFSHEVYPTQRESLRSSGSSGIL